MNDFERFVRGELGDVPVKDNGRYISHKINNYWRVWQEASKRQGQSKKASLAEALLNIAIGYAVAIASQLVIFKIVGIPDLPTATHLEIGLYFTVVSLVRSYALRRLFNWWSLRK